MNYEKSCGAVVFTIQNQKIWYVMVQSKEGHYGFPKGHMEHEETENETALREVFEETGLIPTIIDGFKRYDEYVLPTKKGVLKQVVYFLAKYDNQEITAQEEELSDIILMQYEDAIHVLEFDSLKGILRAADDFIKNIH